MGSLETGVLPLKRTAPLLRSSTNGRSFFHTPRSRLARFLMFEKLHYVQWICTAATFFFVVILFQAFLPSSSVVDKSSGSSGVSLFNKRSPVLEDIGELEFGEGIRFIPSKLLETFPRRKWKDANFSSGLGGTRAAFIKPKIALVLADLSVDEIQLQMVTVAVALKEIGYDIEVYAFEEHPIRSIWTEAGFSFSIVLDSKKMALLAIDWLNYNGVIASSLEAKSIISCLSQEPFKSLPVIWTIHEKTLALRLDQYIANNNSQILNDWKQAFARSTVVVFPTHLLTIMYSTLDTGNYYVIPGSPAKSWKVSSNLASYDTKDPRSEMGYELDDFIIAIVGSQFSYSGLFLEHALILQSLAPVLQKFSSSSHVKVGILSENTIHSYNASLKTLGLKFGFMKENIHLIGSNGDFSSFIGISDVVIYGSFIEEQYFPSILLQAMCLGKLVIAPNITMITKYVNDTLNGYLFPRENVDMLTQILIEAIANEKLSYLAQNVAEAGKDLARNLMVSESIEGYSMLLENVLKFPSEVAIPKYVTDIPSKLKEEWRWELFGNITHTPKYVDDGMMRKSSSIVDKIEEKWNSPQTEGSLHTIKSLDEAFVPINWAEERAIEIVNSRKRLLDEELKDRIDQMHQTWEEVYRNVKKAEKKDGVHDRDDRELERVGQPLCIYEPYFGEGTWPFLHHSALYRGVGLTGKDQRLGGEGDIYAPSQLPILSNGYYRDILGEHGAFFALAKRIDRIHKNAWIGFQSWRLTAQKISLTKIAEETLIDAIESQEHGDALYFWARMDKDPRNPLRLDFWSFCDTINAGNCRFAVSKALQRMYGVPSDWDSLPPMPSSYGNSWGVMHSWAMPTRSFLEFVMFSRMFVDALDSELYDEHHQGSLCYLSLSKDRNCYSRVLELVVNIWAYHSARRIVYINPETGTMEEHHTLKSRKGKMWIKWFSYSILKTMDEDLAEEFDSDYRSNRRGRWLWPLTGEVFWQGMYERERNTRQQKEERKKKQIKNKIGQMKSRCVRQKTLGGSI